MERIVSVENEVHVTLGSNHSTKLLAFKGLIECDIGLVEIL